ncbi:hypothetical protein AB6A23_12125 [Paenibacillus tarimensis]
MNLRKKMTCMLAAALVVLSLSACSQNAPGTNTGNEPIQGETNAPVNGADNQADNNRVDDPAPGNGNAQENGAANLPATKQLELQLESNPETKTAKLAEGNGYSIYVIDIFTFDAAANKLFMNVDKDFYASINKLPSDYNADQLRKEAEDELAELGEVAEETDPLMQDTEFFLAATKDDLTRKILVKEIDGTGYLFTLNVPHREPIEGFGSHALVMLNTIVNQ